VSEAVEKAIRAALESPNVADSNFEAANVVDVLNYIAGAGGQIAKSIAPKGATLTESVVGLTGGMYAVAAAIDRLAEAVREVKS
jgi:hypothetical protein